MKKSYYARAILITVLVYLSYAYLNLELDSRCWDKSDRSKSLLALFITNGMPAILGKLSEIENV